MTIEKLSGYTRRLLTKFYSKKKMHSVIYKETHSKHINWKCPNTYDEKLHYVMVYCMGKRESKYADKVLVREYVKECGLEYLLPEIYGVWDSVKEIKIDNLPKKFALKTNHACGGDYYLLCKDKKKILWDAELKKFEEALKTDFWKFNYEYHYKHIVPKIYAEELLENDAEERMVDYKVHCFGGVPHSILVCSNRGQQLKLDFYDTDWNYLNVCPEQYRSGQLFEKPLGLEIMLEAATKLSKRFPAARIDFYDIKGKVYFGEITLTPGAGNLYYINEEYQKIMGDLFVLPPKNKFSTE